MSARARVWNSTLTRDPAKGLKQGSGLARTGLSRTPKPAHLPGCPQGLPMDDPVLVCRCGSSPKAWGEPPKPRRRRPTGPAAEVVDLVLKRAGDRCEICAGILYGERGRDWSIQHRLPRKAGGTKRPWINAPSNLLALCGDGTTGCHGRAESDRMEAKCNGWLIADGPDVKPELVPVLRFDGWALLAEDGSYERIPAPEGAGVA